ncbi:response regulator transcription factor [Pseudogracilibacillus sp. ICA-222130]|uniref:response regulator transcription factor n=1 Tax=Pseudogracilibacillus sp. ICA-222130 TaxID=3134655 RepID=UPI0030C1B66C
MNETKILVVEDDNDINQLLCNIAKKNNYHTQPAYSGTEALIYLDKQDWDLILLDLMLPGMDGEQILNKITEKVTTPVIIISAKTEKETKINSLKIGADDFITKPFDIDEVVARMESLLRRYRNAKKPQQDVLTYKDIQLDKNTKTVTVNGSIITLTAREYQILQLLMESPQKVFSKPNLFESVWGEPYHADDNTINVHMSNLRNKLTKANPDGQYIKTVWGMGYRMES